MRDRAEVVVRVRRIAEDRAAIAAAAAQNSAMAARTAALLAQERARQHPLDGNRTGRLTADQLAVAAGSGAALREAATAAAQDEAAALGVAHEATGVVVQARAERQAAERLVERRRIARAVEVERRDQRQLDESGLATWSGTG